ncbi:hypothetical protein [Enterobacter kobei]|uniref:hypothetical protein n=1 Tax=Enterobacter kobei TaxID=208224 RepID=UPI00224AFE2F|nr:hypothetical protein [Enterobacter kobei]UZQ67550.1 hypothetical protein OQE50_22215 [Enterobacter kobei]
MSKRDSTLLVLEEALARILNKTPLRVPQARKLSARSVEAEAGLSNGSAYYYPELIGKIALLKQDPGTSASTIRSASGPEKWKEKARTAERLKKQFREENDELKELNAQIAADQYRQMSALREALHKITELEEAIEKLKKELITTRRQNITRI